MINQQQFQQQLPLLAQFAVDKRSKAYNKKIAMDAYKKGKPGLLEKMGIIPNRRDNSATYKRRTKKGKIVIVRKKKKRRSQ